MPSESSSAHSLSAGSSLGLLLHPCPFQVSVTLRFCRECTLTGSGVRDLRKAAFLRSVCLQGCSPSCWGGSESQQKCAVTAGCAVSLQELASSRDAVCTHHQPRAAQMLQMLQINKIEIASIGFRGGTFGFGDSMAKTHFTSGLTRSSQCHLAEHVRHKTSF